ncbi:MAG: hypothetical protein AAB768_02635 [Patescibacteria group bacterium]
MGKDLFGHDQSRSSRVTPDGKSVGRPTNDYLKKLDDKSLIDYIEALQIQSHERAANSMRRRNALMIAGLKAMIEVTSRLE